MRRIFRRAARTLEETGAIESEVRERKLSELRLYSLRKFFRKYSNQMGNENVQYLMGHTVRGSDANYKPQDPEYYRDIYAEKAMPFLRLEAPTPIESEKQIEELRQQLESKTGQLKMMEEKIAKLEPFIELLDKENPEKLGLFVRAWLETDDFYRASEAEKKGQHYKKRFELELTEEQIDKLMEATDSTSIDLAKALQKALNLTIEDLAKNRI